MNNQLRLVLSPTWDDPAPMSATHIRQEQLWRAAWLLVLGRVEEEGPPFLPVSDERQAFRSYVAILTGRVRDQASPPVPVPALVASACWIQLRCAPPPGLISLYTQHVACWRATGLDDHAVLRRLCAMMQRSE
jgi:hypothetical protein